MDTTYEAYVHSITGTWRGGCTLSVARLLCVTNFIPRETLRRKTFAARGLALRFPDDQPGELARGFKPVVFGLAHQGKDMALAFGTADRRGGQFV
jgi:hypothetical protein